MEYSKEDLKLIKSQLTEKATSLPEEEINRILADQSREDSINDSRVENQTGYVFIDPNKGNLDGAEAELEKFAAEIRESTPKEDEGISVKVKVTGSKNKSKYN